MLSTMDLPRTSPCCATCTVIDARRSRTESGFWRESATVLAGGTRGPARHRGLEALGRLVTAPRLQGCA